ncbi:MAG: DMT family transporter [Pseudobdellovibrio sp.]
MRNFLNAVPVYHRAVIELIIAGSIWGASFTLVKWALVDFSTSALIFWRFVVAIILGELTLYILNRDEYKNSHSDLKASFAAGISLGATLIFQTHGLNFTTATNSSFITSLYVVMVPFASFFAFKTLLRWHHVVLSLIAFSGMGLLLNLNKTDFSFNEGDLLTLGAALGGTAHIITVSLGTKKMKSAFRFNVLQTFWALMLLIPFLAYEMVTKNIKIIPDHVGYGSIFSILGLSLFVSLIAFYLQIRAQNVLSTTTASMLCLLEAPYSFIFATVFLKEALSPLQFAGAGLIMLSSLLSVYMERPNNG